MIISSDMDRVKYRWVLWMSVAAFFASVTSIVLVMCRIEPITADWMSVLVGVLSLLVMLLIGWQIFTLLDFNRLKTNIETAKKTMELEAQRTMLTTAGALADFYYGIGNPTVPISQVQFNYLNYRIVSILHASNLGYIDLCNSVTKAIFETMPDTLYISERDKQTLITALMEVKHKSEIKNFQRLMKMILDINTKQ